MRLWQFFPTPHVFYDLPSNEKLEELRAFGTFSNLRAKIPNVLDLLAAKGVVVAQEQWLALEDTGEFPGIDAKWRPMMTALVQVVRDQPEPEPIDDPG